MRRTATEGGEGMCGSCRLREVECECAEGGQRGADSVECAARAGDHSNAREAGAEVVASPSTPSAYELTYERLRAMVEALAPLAELDAIAGLRGRSRDPREHPSSRGEQRDSAAALDAARDHHALAAGRRAWERYARLSAETQETARWVALIGAALPRGECPSVEAFSMLCGRLLGPARLREREEETRERAAVCALSVRVAQQRIARRGVTAETALLLDAARSAFALMGHAHDVAVVEVHTWGRSRLEGLARLWAELSE